MNRLMIRLFMGLIALFLAAPVIVIAGVSLNEKKRLLFPPTPISTSWYVELFANPSWLESIFYSLTIAFSSAFLAVLVALPIAYSLWRTGYRPVRLLFNMGIAPFILPPVVMALGFLIFFTMIDHIGLIENVIIGHAIFFLALPLVTINLGLQSLDRELIEAAQGMGANPRQIFMTIIFPLILPYIICGYAFAFVLSLNEYIIAYMIAGFAIETLPIKIFNSLRYGYTPFMAVVSTMFIIISVGVFALIGWFGNLPRLLGALDPKDH